MAPKHITTMSTPPDTVPQAPTRWARRILARERTSQAWSISAAYSGYFGTTSGTGNITSVSPTCSAEPSSATAGPTADTGPPDAGHGRRPWSWA